MGGQFTHKEVNDLLRIVRSMSDDGDVQLAIIGRVFITGCQSCKVKRDTAIAVLEKMWDEPVELIPLPDDTN